MTTTRYAPYHRGPVGWLRRRWVQLTAPRPVVADGYDYTGWRVRVLSLPAPGVRPGIGTEGDIVGCEGEGSRRRHEVTFGRETWTVPLPNRHLALIPPLPPR